MTYREPQKDEQIRAAQELRALAARGEEKRRAQQAAGSSSSSGPSLAARVGVAWAKHKAARQLRRSCSRFAELSGFWFRFGTFPLFLVGFFFLAPTLSLGSFFLWTVGSWLALVVAGHLVGYALSGVALRRELAWLRGLPFPLAGYLEALHLASSSSHKWHESTHEGMGGSVTYPAVETVAIQVDLARPLESRSFVADLLRATVPQARLAQSYDTGFRFYRGDLGCLHTCYGLRRWMHQVVDDLLLPLHRAHQVQQVELLTTKYKGVTPGQK